MQRTIIGSDHGGYDLKEKVIKILSGKGFDIKDAGCLSKDSCDYPDYGFAVASEVGNNVYDKGILICRSGIGMSIVANKIKNVRAALCYNKETARVAREHNDSNILCLGAREIDHNLAKKITKIWLNTEHSDAPRHRRRVQQMKHLDK